MRMIMAQRGNEVYSTMIVESEMTRKMNEDFDNYCFERK